MSSSTQPFTDIDEEALLRDVDGRTDDSLENEEVMLEDDDFDIDDDDLKKELDEAPPKNMEARPSSIADPGTKSPQVGQKPGQREKITFGDASPPQVVDLKASNPAAGDARQKRRARFGTVIGDADAEAKLKRAQRFGVVSESTAKLARIARFGEIKPTAGSPAPALPRAAATRGRGGRGGRARGRGGKFGAFNLSVMETTKQKQTLRQELMKEQEERKRQRSLRFQGVPAAKTSAPANGDEERKLSRAQRFGST